MGWQVINATVLHAGNTIINPNGIFTYSGPPALGNLIFSSAPAAGTDDFGNAYVQGAAAYVTLGGDRIALQLGLSSFGGTPAAAFFTHDETSPAFSDPMVGGTSATPAGCISVLFSGESLNTSAGSGIEAADSTASGVAGGTVTIVAGQTTLNSSGGPIPITNTDLTPEGAAPATYSQSYTQFMANRVTALVNTIIAAGIGQV